MSLNWKIYHNARCSKSRQALEILRSHKIEPIIVDYLEEGLDAKAVEILIINSGRAPEQFLRRKEKEFSHFQEAKIDSAKSVAKILAACPKLLERPIIEHGKKVIIARPPELLEELF